MTTIRKRVLTGVLVVTGALAITGPVAGASAAVIPPFGSPIAGVTIGGNQIGTATCVGTNRPSFAGNNGSTSAQTCGALTSSGGPQTGQITTVYGPTTTGSPGSVVIVSAGPVTGS
jgi:hypothetical protein